MPREMSFIEAAAAPLTFLTAWHMLVSLAKLQPGETVLITGAGSGVATAAIQIARCLSAHVIVTSTSADKLLRAKALGAHEGILCPPDDLARSIRKMTSGRMVDVAFEHVGGEHFSSAMKSLRRSGRLVTCGATANASVMVDLRYIFDRQLQILGAKMGGLAEMRRVWELISSGHLKPVIDRTFTLDDARAAHDYLAQKSQFGKVVLTL
jgi:NADPH:quinone reductase-like Zn-dependent oxidoreductase